MPKKNLGIAPSDLDIIRKFYAEHPEWDPYTSAMRYNEDLDRVEVVQFSDLGVIRLTLSGTSGEWEVFA